MSLSSKPASVESGDSLALLSHAQKGDAESFSELCRLHEARLLRQATLLCPNSPEDLVQECLFAAWKSLPKYNRQCQFFTWLCAIMLNQHRNMRRKRWPLSFAALFNPNTTEDDFAHLADHSHTPDHAAELSDRSIFVQSCIRRLSPKHREVIHLRFYVDGSLDGIAIALGCSVGTVKSRLFHALENLRKMIHTAQQRGI